MRQNLFGSRVQLALDALEKNRGVDHLGSCLSLAQGGAIDGFPLLLRPSQRWQRRASFSFSTSSPVWASCRASRLCHFMRFLTSRKSLVLERLMRSSFFHYSNVFIVSFVILLHLLEHLLVVPLEYLKKPQVLLQLSLRTGLSTLQILH